MSILIITLTRIFVILFLAAKGDKHTTKIFIIYTAHAVGNVIKLTTMRCALGIKQESDGKK
jgi:hypothetical protein